jgi:hypothetical protein
MENVVTRYNRRHQDSNVLRTQLINRQRSWFRFVDRPAILNLTRKRQVSAYENPFAYSHSRDTQFNPVTRKVVKIDCNIYFAYNKWARYVNRTTSKNYIPLKRTLPWLMGSMHKMGDEPALMSVGGLFPDSYRVLQDLCDKQLDALEEFYGRHFCWPRIKSFEEFITCYDPNDTVPTMPILIPHCFWFKDPSMAPGSLLAPINEAMDNINEFALQYFTG